MNTVKQVFVVIDRKKGSFCGVAGSFEEAKTIAIEWGGELKTSIVSQYVSLAN